MTENQFAIGMMIIGALTGIFLTVAFSLPMWVYMSYKNAPEKVYVPHDLKLICVPNGSERYLTCKW